MRQVMHMFYATVFLLLGSAGKPINQSDETCPHSEIFTSESGRAKSTWRTTGSKIVYGRVHWEQLLQNVRSAI